MPKLALSGAEPQPLYQPRKPERANGIRRYKQLLTAAEQLLERDGHQALTIQNIAKEAGVPMASVYHFFPTPAAASVAVAESYLAAFQDIIRRPVTRTDAAEWTALIKLFMQRTLNFYRSHPYAQRLILGSDYSWHIRQADLANNAEVAALVATHLHDYCRAIPFESVQKAVAVAITIHDSIWSLSVAEHEVITKQYAEDAIIATIGYLRQKLGLDDSGHAGSAPGTTDKP